MLDREKKETNNLQQSINNDNKSQPTRQPHLGNLSPFAFAFITEKRGEAGEGGRKGSWADPADAYAKGLKQSGCLGQ